MNTQPTRITEQLESILEILKRLDDRIIVLEQTLYQLQHLVQQKYLTKEDLESFFTKKPLKAITLEPPFRG